MDSADEGAQGLVVKWACGSHADEPTLFKLAFEDRDPCGGLGGEDGCGIDLKEYEVLALLRHTHYGTRLRTRQNSRKGLE